MLIVSESRRKGTFLKLLGEQLVALKQVTEIEPLDQLRNNLARLDKIFIDISDYISIFVFENFETFKKDIFRKKQLLEKFEASSKIESLRKAQCDFSNNPDDFRKLKEEEKSIIEYTFYCEYFEWVNNLYQFLIQARLIGIDVFFFFGKNFLSTVEDENPLNTNIQALNNSIVITSHLNLPELSRLLKFARVINVCDKDSNESGFTQNPIRKGDLVLSSENLDSNVFKIGLCCQGLAINYYKEGEKHFNNGSYEEAIRSFNHAIFLDDSCSQAFIMKIKSHIALKKIPEALSVLSLETIKIIFQTNIHELLNLLKELEDLLFSCDNNIFKNWKGYLSLWILDIVYRYIDADTEEKKFSLSIYQWILEKFFNFEHETQEPINDTLHKESRLIFAAIDIRPTAEPGIAYVYARLKEDAGMLKDALITHRDASTKADPKAQLWMGKDHCKNEQYQEAFTHFKLAADQGNPEAQTLAGYCYEMGLGTAFDPKNALVYYQKASDNNYFLGFSNIATCYRKGFAVPRDENKAFIYYLWSITYNPNIFACINLGICYQHGIGTTLDEEQAKQYFDLAVKEYNKHSKHFNQMLGLGLKTNHPEAQLIMAVCYEKGIGVAIDINEAVKYYEQVIKLTNTMEGYEIASLKYSTLNEELGRSSSLRVDLKRPREGNSLGEPSRKKSRLESFLCEIDAFFSKNPDIFSIPNDSTMNIPQAVTCFFAVRENLISTTNSNDLAPEDTTAAKEHERKPSNEP